VTSAIYILVVEDELFSRWRAIDLVDMPGSMDGLKLAHAIRKRWPPIELILTSGHFDISEDKIPERGRFFAKPYRDHEIISALRNFAV
jgi:CheY-like chemotaxis protein